MLSHSTAITAITAPLPFIIAAIHIEVIDTFNNIATLYAIDAITLSITLLMLAANIIDGADYAAAITPRHDADITALLYIPPLLPQTFRHYYYADDYAMKRTQPDYITTLRRH